MTRALRILGVQWRGALLLAMQYRLEFALEAVIELAWTATALVPLLVAWSGRATVGGWSLGEALVVVGFFTLLQAIVEGAIAPSLVATVEQIRAGTFDHVLLKPADAQLLASTSRLHPWRAINVATALTIFVVAFASLGRAPSFSDVGLTLLLFACALASLYSLWILVVSAAFYAIKLENVADLLTALFDAARWPSSVFRGALRIVFTFVVPLAVMTTFPARALLGAIDAPTIGVAIATSVIFSSLARWAWQSAIAQYTSASS